MILRHFAALAVHDVEQILAGVSNAPDLNKRGTDPTNDDIGLTIADPAVDHLDKLATGLALGERRRKLENYLKHFASIAIKMAVCPVIRIERLLKLPTS
jgi:hypothetical protein